MMISIFRKFLSCLLIGSVLFSASAQDQDMQDPIDAAWEKAIDADPSTAGMVEACASATAQWDTRMNDAYGKLKSAMDPDEWKQLVVSQKAWLTFRDAQIASIGARRSRMDGTMWSVDAAEQTMDLTKNRTQFLERTLQLINE